MPALLTLITSTAPVGPVDPIALAIREFAGYGVVGVVAIVLGIVAWRGWRTDQARWSEALARERARADRAEQANDDLNRELRSSVMPLLERVATVNAELVREVRESARNTEIALRDRERR